MIKILLVEDDVNLGEIYKARLEAEGFQVFVAKDGEEGLMVAKSSQPDLLISDVMMPRVSGMEMLEIIKSSNVLKNMKVIMLTALNQNTDEERAKDLGADRYLVKSQVTLEDIVSAVHDLLGDSKEITDTSTASTSNTDTTPLAPTENQTPEAMTQTSPETDMNPSEMPVMDMPAEQTPEAPAMEMNSMPAEPTPEAMTQTSPESDMNPSEMPVMDMPAEPTPEAPISVPMTAQFVSAPAEPTPEAMTQTSPETDMNHSEMPVMDMPAEPTPEAPAMEMNSMPAEPVSEPTPMTTTANNTNPGVPMNDMTARPAPMPSFRNPSNLINDITPPTPPAPSV